MFEISISSGGAEVTGRVTTMNLSGESAQFGAKFPADTPVLPIGSALDVVLRTVGADHGTHVTGHLALQARAEDGVHCEVSFSRETAALLRGLVYERRAPRVKPSTREPVVVTIAGAVGVQVHDLSIGGVGLLVSSESQGRISRWTFPMKLRLPGDDDSMKFFGEVRLRRLLGSMVLYGVQFDPDRTRDLEEKQESIQRYVMRRQREVLQERAARRHV